MTINNKSLIELTTNLLSLALLLLNYFSIGDKKFNDGNYIKKASYKTARQSNEEMKE